MEVDANFLRELFGARNPATTLTDGSISYAKPADYDIRGPLVFPAIGDAPVRLITRADQICTASGAVVANCAQWSVLLLHSF